MSAPSDGKDSSSTLKMLVGGLSLTTVGLLISTIVLATNKDSGAIGTQADVGALPVEVIPAPGSTYLDQGLVDCMSITLSLDAIVSHITDGEISTAIVTTNLEVGYDDLREQYATTNLEGSEFETSPPTIVEALSEADVQATVIFAAQCDYKVTTRSGGHSYIGMSSCNNNCIQLDVGRMNHIDVKESGKQLNVGPGVRLEELVQTFVTEGVFIPTGECKSIGIGGHTQTGGFGPWGRSFGYFTGYVDSFRIVLPDGSIRSVEKPGRKPLTSQPNNDLFYAVLGGASGSFGTVVDTVFNTNKDDDFHAFYWEVNFWYDSEKTLPGIIKMLEKYAGMVESGELDQDDTRWNIWWTLVGSKSLLAKTGLLPPFNFFQMDFIWVVPKKETSNADAFADAQAVYDDIVGACDDCVLLDDFFDSLPIDQAVKDALKTGVFGSTAAANKPISKMIQEITLVDFTIFSLSEYPFKSGYQQGPKFPAESTIAAIIKNIDMLVPKVGEPKFLTSQLVTLPSKRHTNDDLAMPFQSDAFGVTFDVWDFTSGQEPAVGDYHATITSQVQESVISATGGKDHRMFWAAHGEPCLDCGDWKYYYESEEKYDRLREIKSCVDPDNVFANRLSIPLHED